jgi:hypothetical protein
MYHIVMAMSDPVLVALITATVGPAIAGIYTIIAKILDFKLKNVPVPKTTVIVTIGDHRRTVYVSLGKVLLHAGIVQLAIEIFGFFIGSWYGAFGISFGDKYFTPNFSVFLLIAYIFAFEWVAVKIDRVIRWKYLLYVTIGVIILEIISNLIAYMIMRQQITTPLIIADIVVICIRTFGGMAIATAITSAMKPN